MKLYTEEQVIEAMTKCFLGHRNMEDYDYELEYSIIKQLTPIELPNDEEIRMQTQFASNDYYWGAQWMKKLILNKNK